MSRGGRRRGRRSPRQRMLLAFNCAVVLVLLTTAGGLTYVYSKYSQLPRVQLGSVLSEQAGSDEPRNFLLVGVDSAANLAQDDPAARRSRQRGGLRSDTMMILRLDPRTERASLLSLPRDLWVPLASGGNQRLNSAIQSGGPGELIDNRPTGLPGHPRAPLHPGRLRRLPGARGRRRRARRLLRPPGPTTRGPSSPSRRPGA